MAQSFLKDPSAILDYQIDWSDWLDTDTIATSAWSATTGIMINSDTNTTTTATVWLSGGTEGASYTVTNRIVTAAGRQDDRAILVMVIDR